MLAVSEQGVQIVLFPFRHNGEHLINGIALRTCSFWINAECLIQFMRPDLLALLLMMAGGQDAKAGE